METDRATTADCSHDRDYDAFLRRIQERFTANLSHGPLFRTDAEGLFEAYLDALPGERQYHTCHACRRFIGTYGGLVTINAEGRVQSAIWDVGDAPVFYKQAINAVAELVRKAKVTGVFLTKEPVWGQPRTGDWQHFAVTPPESIAYRDKVLTAGQAMAEKTQDYETVKRALAEFTEKTTKQALTLLQTDSLYRSEKVLGPVQWLNDLHSAIKGSHGFKSNALTWRFIATAPAGFCHPRSSMAGTLLEDIAAGMDFAEVSRRFAAKMHPLQYQRPQAAPSAGNIAAAEKLVETLGIRRSLERRYARLDEVEAAWKPRAKAESTTNGVFGHLKPKGEANVPRMFVPPVAMTWDKFSRTVLPTAETIEFYVPPTRDSFTALVTAVHADAPPILQWDSEDRRNPVSWYVYSNGSPASQWGLAGRTWVKVSAVTLKPPQWGDGGFEHQGNGVILILEGARDTNTATGVLFPEILKAELRGVRATIEAYSNAATLAGTEEATANGIMLGGDSWNAMVRVTSGGTRAEYKLDRWD